MINVLSNTRSLRLTRFLNIAGGVFHCTSQIKIKA